MLKKRKEILKGGEGWYPCKGNKHLSLAPKEKMAERAALFPSQPLWILVSFVCMRKTKDTRGQDTAFLSFFTIKKFIHPFFLKKTKKG